MILRQFSLRMRPTKHRWQRRDPRTELPTSSSLIALMLAPSKIKICIAGSVKWRAGTPAERCSTDWPLRSKGYFAGPVSHPAHQSSSHQLGSFHVSARAHHRRRFSSGTARLQMTTGVLFDPPLVQHTRLRQKPKGKQKSPGGSAVRDSVVA